MSDGMTNVELMDVLGSVAEDAYNRIADAELEQRNRTQGGCLGAGVGGLGGWAGAAKQRAMDSGRHG